MFFFFSSPLFFPTIEPTIGKNLGTFTAACVRSGTGGGEISLPEKTACQLAEAKEKKDTQKKITTKTAFREKRND